MSRKKYQHNENSLGGRLHKFREFSGIKVIVFCELLNISQASLSDYENNKTIISGEAIINLRQKTDINIDWLLIGEGEMLRGGPEKIEIELFTKIFRQIDQHLSRLKEKLDSKPKARLIALLYNYFKSTKEEVNQHTIISYLKLVTREDEPLGD